MNKFDLVEERLATCKAVAWDECHKIYILMDDEQVSLTKSYGYEVLVTPAEVGGHKELLEIVKTMFDASCPLRFITAIATATGFEEIIGQEIGAKTNE